MPSVIVTGTTATKRRVEAQFTPFGSGRCKLLIQCIDYTRALCGSASAKLDCNILRHRSKASNLGLQGPDQAQLEPCLPTPWVRAATRFPFRDARCREQLRGTLQNAGAPADRSRHGSRCAQGEAGRSLRRSASTFRASSALPRGCPAHPRTGRRRTTRAHGPHRTAAQRVMPTRRARISDPRWNTRAASRGERVHSRRDECGGLNGGLEVGPPSQCKLVGISNSAIPMKSIGSNVPRKMESACAVPKPQRQIGCDRQYWMVASGITRLRSSTVKLSDTVASRRV
jgi:hypothetical protein